jgi:Holliday junction resolvase RusA-like endonuclease
VSLIDIMVNGERSDPLVVVSLPGQPQGKGRPRFRNVQTRDGRSFTTVYTPAETARYEAQLRAAALDAMRGKAILDGPLEVMVFAYFDVPESWSKAKRAAALAGDVRPTGKPDWENVCKVLDAFNPYTDPRTKMKIPVLWTDDAIVVDGRIVKLYAVQRPGLVIEIRRAGPPPPRWRPRIIAT